MFQFRKIGLEARMALFVFCTILAVLIFSTVFTRGVVSDTLTNEVFKDAAVSSNSIANHIFEDVLSGNREAVVSQLIEEKFSHTSIEYIILINEAGEAWAHTLTDYPLDTIPDYLKISEGSAASTRIIQVEGNDVYEIATPLKFGRGVLKIGYKMGAITAATNKALLTLLEVAVLEMIISIIIVLLITKVVTKPIVLLKNSIAEISKGNLDVKAAVVSNDEIGELASVFNQMTVDLKKTRSGLEKQTKDLEAESARLQAVISSMGEGLFVVDKAGQVILVNNAATRMVEAKSKEIIDKHFQQVFQFVRKDGTALRDEEQMIMCALTEKKVCEINTEDDIYMKTTQGKLFPVFEVSTPLLNDVGEIIGAVVIFDDISERKKLDDSRISFISIASHQLRTPLTSMRWFAEMLIAGDAGVINDAQRKFVERIYQGTDRMIGLVNLLLQIARVEAGRVKIEPTPINFNNLIRGLTVAMRVLLDGKSQKVEIMSDPDPFPAILMDQEVVWQVFQNLISNANRYSPEKSTITISMVKKGPLAEFSVKDSGIGIPKDVQGRIFNKFFRAENALKLIPEGSGLGLSLVKSLVEEWGGNIWFESDEGKGATFFFTVPLTGMKSRKGDVTISV
jgi:two-component system sensor histidine kinase VicK